MTEDQIYKDEIKEKISSMKDNEFRTTNFSLIEYFVKNDFRPYNQEELILLLLNDYNMNPTKYILSHDRRIFKNEASFKISIKLSISRNKSFMKGPGIDNLSLNLQNTVHYLRAMYPKYQKHSINIATPYKIFTDNNKKRTFHSVTKNIKKNKEGILLNKLMNDIIQPIESIQINMPFRSVTKTEKIKNEDISASNLISNSNNSFSLTNSNENPVQNENAKEKETPDIFKKRLFSDAIISLFNNAHLDKICNSFDEYLLTVNSKVINKEIEKELEVIRQSISEIYDAKANYNILCGEINESQKELHNLFILMKNQLNQIEIEIGVKSYSYELYCKLRDILFEQEKGFDKALKSIEELLMKLIDVEIGLVVHRLFINDHLTVLKNKGFCDFGFSRLDEMIIKELKINSFSLNKELNKYTMKEKENIYSDAKITIEKFKNEKKSIIDGFNDIDCFVGNITSY